jgi:hypothetical protein
MNVWIIRGAGTAGEHEWAAPTGDSGDFILLVGAADIRGGDRLTSDVWEETRVATHVYPMTDMSGSVVRKKVAIVPLSEWLEQHEAEPPSIRQTVCGNVRSVAARDAIQANVTFVAILSALEETITEAEIPTEERVSLLSKIRDLINNPRLSGIATALTAEFLKRAAGG